MQFLNQIASRLTILILYPGLHITKMATGKNILTNSVAETAARKQPNDLLEFVLEKMNDKTNFFICGVQEFGVRGIEMKISHPYYD